MYYNHPHFVIMGCPVMKTGLLAKVAEEMLNLPKSLTAEEVEPPTVNTVSEIIG